MSLLALVFASNFVFTWVIAIACVCACACACVASENQALENFCMAVFKKLLIYRCLFHINCCPKKKSTQCPKA